MITAKSARKNMGDGIYNWSFDNAMTLRNILKEIKKAKGKGYSSLTISDSILWWKPARIYFVPGSFFAKALEKRGFEIDFKDPDNPHVIW